MNDKKIRDNVVMVDVNGDVTRLEKAMVTISAQGEMTYAEYLDMSDVVCLLDVSECDEDGLEGLCDAIARLDSHEVNTLRAVLEHHHGMKRIFTIDEVEYYLPTFRNYYILLEDVIHLYDFGMYIFDNYMDTGMYDGIRHDIDYKKIGNALIMDGKAAQTSLGYLMILR